LLYSGNPGEKEVVKKGAVESKGGGDSDLGDVFHVECMLSCSEFNKTD
jgi:hypothetical protein